MIHKAKDLSPDQKAAIEGLLGRAISENEEISIRTITLPSPRKSLPRGADGVSVGPRINDPDCHRHECSDFRFASASRTASPGTAGDHRRARCSALRKRGSLCGV